MSKLIEIINAGRPTTSEKYGIKIGDTFAYVCQYTNDTIFEVVARFSDGLIVCESCAVYTLDEIEAAKNNSLSF